MPESVRDRPTTSHEHIFLFAKSRKYYYDADAVREPLSEATLADKRNGTGRHTHKNTKYEGKQDLPSWYREKTFVNPEEGRNLRSVWTFSTRPYKGAHFATFPPELPKRCIMAGSPEKCCAVCGKGWKRVTEKTTRFESGSGAAGRSADEVGGKWDTKDCGKNLKLGPCNEITTLGFSPACTCGSEETRPAVILDPFAGSGTTLAVAAELGREYIGIEISEEYIPLIRERLSKVQRPLLTGG